MAERTASNVGSVSKADGAPFPFHLPRPASRASRATLPLYDAKRCHVLALDWSALFVGLSRGLFSFFFLVAAASFELALTFSGDLVLFMFDLPRR